MRLVLDASVLVALIVQETHSERALGLVAGQAPDALLVSDFAMLEVASAIGRRVRMTSLTEAEGRRVLDNLGLWCAQATTPCALSPADVARARAWLERLDLNLRAPDALHLAMAQRLDARLATLDEGLGRAAHGLGVGVEPP